MQSQIGEHLSSRYYGYKTTEMGKNKLKKFAEMKTFGCVFEFPFGALRDSGFDMKGHWREQYFKNTAPLVLELGCGKGEYTVGLAKACPDKNYIGIDIKGARIWKGAKEAEENRMVNVAFLRTGIELIENFFAPGEVDEIWITFPDPQMQKTRHRLMSARFLQLYSRILKPGGIIHLKTDSPFLFEFSYRLLQENNIIPLTCQSDLYGAGNVSPEKSIKTFYECQWLARGKKIKLIEFAMPESREFTDPDESDIDRDDYHSFPRGMARQINNPE